jgi:hypothetical protein
MGRRINTPKPLLATGAEAIQLTRGLWTILDLEDYEILKVYKWYAFPSDAGTHYAARQQNKRVVFMHNFILNVSPGMKVDHTDNDGLNNRRYNLRECTPGQNGFNKRAHNGEGFKGVYWKANKERWVSEISFGGKTVTLGHYKAHTQAALAYNEAAKVAHGDFAKLNIVEDYITQETMLKVSSKIQRFIKG